MRTGTASPRLGSRTPQGLEVDPEEVLIDCDRPAGRDCVVRWLAEQGLDYLWAREIPGALVEAVRRCVAGEPPLLGTLPVGLFWHYRAHQIEWVTLGNRETVASVSRNGWRVISGEQGPEIGDEGRSLAEAAVRTRYWIH